MAVDRSRGIAPWILLAALGALPTAAWSQLFVCTTPGGRTLTGDQPPPDAPPRGEAPSDAADWVVIVVRPTGFSNH